MSQRIPRGLAELVAAMVLTTAAMAITAGAASARGATRWVSDQPAVPYSLGRSCTSPGYNTVQSAINAAPAGTTVKVCAGTYTEQLSITKGISLLGIEAPTIKLPDPAADSTTACDTAPGTEHYQPNQDLVSICTPETVTVKGLALEAKWPGGTCYDSLYGILVAGGATLDASKVTLDGAGAFPINGCQGGVGIQVGMSWVTDSLKVGKADLIKDRVENYQKNGMTIDGVGSQATITKTTVAGAGPTSITAQNGIQVSDGAQATITTSTISGNDYTPATYTATGVLFYGAAAGSGISGSKVNSDQTGIYYESGSPTPPASSEVLINDDKLSEDREVGVELSQGDATLDGDKISGPGGIGVGVVQYEGQPYASASSADGDRIAGMTEAAVEVWSDGAPGDIPGNFKIENSSISHNAAEVINNSKNFTVNGQLGDW